MQAALVYPERAFITPVGVWVPRELAANQRASQREPSDTVTEAKKAAPHCSRKRF